MFLSSKSAPPAIVCRFPIGVYFPPPAVCLAEGEGMGRGGGDFADDCRGYFSPGALKDDRNIRVGFV